MLNRIKNRLEKRLAEYIVELDTAYSLKKISPLLLKSLREFLTRRAKRIRPELFIIGYLGFAKKPNKDIYTAALSLELLHSFSLIHDDIIDDSDLRRGLPSMHKLLENGFERSKRANKTGKDLAMVVGDILYAMALRPILSSRFDPARKQMAMKILIEAAVRTGSGEFMEILHSVKDIGRITKNDIYKTYDLKTGYYSFAAPLKMGAILGGATISEAGKLAIYGTCIGRAFQIKDDITDIFSDEKYSGKSSLTDIGGSVKTLLLWHAYKRSKKEDLRYLKKVLGADETGKKDLLKIRKIIRTSGSLSRSIDDMRSFIIKAKKTGASINMRPRSKKLLYSYIDDILKLEFSDPIFSRTADQKT